MTTNLWRSPKQGSRVRWLRKIYRDFRFLICHYSGKPPWKVSPLVFVACLDACVSYYLLLEWFHSDITSHTRYFVLACSMDVVFILSHHVGRNYTLVPYRHPHTRARVCVCEYVNKVWRATMNCYAPASSLLCITAVCGLIIYVKMCNVLFCDNV